MEEKILCCGCAMACVLTLHTGEDGTLTVGGRPCRKDKRLTSYSRHIAGVT